MNINKNFISLFSLIVLLILLFTCWIKLFYLQNGGIETEGQTQNSSQNINTRDISWQEAITLLQECKITSIYQKHNLTVTLTDKNNQVYQTTEPKLDDIIYQTSRLRSDCNDIITTVTE